MNNDRFLTRVFDKQEKRMIYPGYKLMIANRIDFEYEFFGITDEGLIVETNYFNSNVCGEPSHHTDIIPFEDRYIPMQCLGRKDKNKKLIYGEDIIKTPNHKYICYWDEESGALWFNRFDNECQIMFFDFGCEIEIIGNNWEHPKLMEKSK